MTPGTTDIEIFEESKVNVECESYQDTCQPLLLATYTIIRPRD